MKDKSLYHYNVLHKVYQWMLSKKKKIEVRLLNEKTNNSQVGDYLVFHHIDDYGKIIKAKIVAKEVYDNVEELLEKNDVNDILPNSNKDEIIRLLKDIYEREY